MYYQHSGRFSIGGILLGTSVGAILGTVLAIAYGKGLILIPEVHLAAFATMAFGGFVGASTGYGLVWGHVRNKRVTLMVAALTSTWALYVSWLVWLATTYRLSSGRPFVWIKLGQHPAYVWNLIQWTSQHGTWGTDSSSPTTGWALWLIWSLEAVIVIGLGMVAAVAAVQHRAYCENCGCWCRIFRPFFLAPVQDTNQLRLQLENKDFRELENLGPGTKGGDRLIVALQSCDQCNQLHTVSVTQMLVKKKKLGQPHVSSTHVVSRLIIGQTEAQTLRRLSEKIASMAKTPAKQARGAAAGGSL